MASRRVTWNGYVIIAALALMAILLAGVLGYADRDPPGFAEFAAKRVSTPPTTSRDPWDNQAPPSDWPTRVEIERLRQYAGDFDFSKVDLVVRSILFEGKLPQRLSFWVLRPDYGENRTVGFSAPVVKDDEMVARLEEWEKTLPQRLAQRASQRQRHEQEDREDREKFDEQLRRLDERVRNGTSTREAAERGKKYFQSQYEERVAFTNQRRQANEANWTSADQYAESLRAAIPASKQLQEQARTLVEAEHREFANKVKGYVRWVRAQRAIRECLVQLLLAFVVLLILAPINAYFLLYRNTSFVPLGFLVFSTALGMAIVAVRFVYNLAVLIILDLTL